MLGAYYPRDRENILCINVSRYLPKEKEETNFPCMHKGTSAKRDKGKARNKKWNKSKPSRRLPWPCDSWGNNAIFAHEYVIFYRRRNYIIEGETSPINRSLIPHISFIQSLRDWEPLSLKPWPNSSLSLVNFWFLFWHLGLSFDLVVLALRL